MFAPPALPPPPPIAAETWTAKSPARLTSPREVEPIQLSRFTIERNYLALEGGRLLLRLREHPVLEVDPTTLNAKVIGWDISVHTFQAENVDKLMARKFSVLFSKADRDELTADEKGTWLSILDRVDFTMFSIERSAPHYLEGTLRRRSPDCIVDWSDGRSERVNHQVAASLSEVEPGELFGAYVKLGSKTKAMALERVTLLSQV